MDQEGERQIVLMIRRVHWRAGAFSAKAPQEEDGEIAILQKVPSVFALVTAAHSLVRLEFQHQTSFDANADATSPQRQSELARTSQTANCKANGAVNRLEIAPCKATVKSIDEILRYLRVYCRNNPLFTRVKLPGIPTP